MNGGEGSLPREPRFTSRKKEGDPETIIDTVIQYNLWSKGRSKTTSRDRLGRPKNTKSV